jgi:Holliday junction resolvase RusA-like endonuclease
MITLNIKYPSLNEYIKVERTNRYAAAKMKKDYTYQTKYIAMGQEKIKTPCKLRFTWYIKNKRVDPDNTAFAKKFALDGLVKAGILEDDTHKHILGFEDIFIVSDKPKLEIEVYE